MATLHFGENKVQSEILATLVLRSIMIMSFLHPFSKDVYSMSNSTSFSTIHQLWILFVQFSISIGLHVMDNGLVLQVRKMDIWSWVIRWWTNMVYTILAHELTKFLTCETIPDLWNEAIIHDSNPRDTELYKEDSKLMNSAEWCRIYWTWETHQSTWCVHPPPQGTCN